VVSHIIFQSPRLRLGELGSHPAKRLLQQYLPRTDISGKSVLQDRLIFLVELFAGLRVEIFARLFGPVDLALAVVVGLYPPLQLGKVGFRVVYRFARS
jgi:hypothetical protein